MWRVGAGPFVEGLRLTSGWAVTAALAITAITTACCAWRWRLVAAGLGADIPMSAAVGGYYRSQFLNATLPGGVLGDVHRGVRHGRAVADMSRGLRSVAWERAAGQTVQLVVTATVLLLVAASADARMVAVVVLAIVAVVLGLWAVGRRGGMADAEVAASVAGGSDPVVGRPDSPSGDGVHGSGRFARTVRRDLREAVLTRHAGPRIVLASVIVVAGHVAVFAIAVDSTGTELTPGRLVPLALVVLQAAALPTNIAGWGPREGASAWAFGAAGLGAAAGVTVAVVFGVLALLATLPGGVLLLTDWRRARRDRPAGPRVAADPASPEPGPAGGAQLDVDDGPELAQSGLPSGMWPHDHRDGDAERTRGGIHA